MTQPENAEQQLDECIERLRITLGDQNNEESSVKICTLLQKGGESGHILE